MITASQQDYIEEHAYIPEHMVHYVTAISQAEPFLLGSYLTYSRKDLLIFIGYPLKEDFEEKKMEKTLDEARRRFKPKEISLTAPKIPSSIAKSTRSPSDYYYKLDLSTLSISQKLRNMLKRAGRDLVVERVRELDKEHHQMVNEFFNTHRVDEATQFIMKRIPEYLSSAPSVWVFSARERGGALVAFDIAEFGARQYAIYMFNFTSRSHYVPGASDLLLSEVIKFAKEKNKKFINLGLGINTGVTFFKKKWGGFPLYPYNFCLTSLLKEDNQDSLLNKL
jgi:hypothetical protein